MMIMVDDSIKEGGELSHYGTKRHSGRYPYGSGENPYQHELNFIQKQRELRKQGLKDKEIAEYFGMTTREYKSQRAVASTTIKEAQRSEVLRLMQSGKSIKEISRIMDKPESTIRYLAKPEVNSSIKQTKATVDILKQELDKTGYVDVGKGVAASMGITESRLDTALQALKNQGYVVDNIHVKQPWAQDQSTTVRVLAKEGTTKKEIYENRDKIGVVSSMFETQFSTELAPPPGPIKSISSKKVEVAYKEDGGGKKDGVIEIRRGAEGLDMGEARYAQVRIGVDGTHYLKGMAVYADDLPSGVDIRFNTSKSKDSVSNKMDAFKEMQGPPSDPVAAFKASIKPGGQKGYLNIISEEGDWATWSKTLSSQMLSKQSTQLAKRQLNAAKLQTKTEFDEINSLTNPVLRKHLLQQFADKCETDAVTLKAAALPRQASHVILPLTTIKDTEIYAPMYRNGDTVVLVRHPHGGTFEIPELKVNNNNKEAKRLFENARDAVGISSNVAAQLSGADFDGDTVIVIPNNNRSIKASPAIKTLQEFEPKVSYKATDRTPRVDSKGNTMTPHTKGVEMGVVSNLITDMTIRGAKQDEIVRAVKYSMVVIDAEKHQLDYKQAKKDFGIDSLKKKYQVHPDGKVGGASTLISRSSSTVRVPEVKRAYRPNAEGDIPYIPTGRTITKKNGKVEPAITKVQAMRYVKDANELSSHTQIENIYAEYANSMKDYARLARRTAGTISDNTYQPAAAKAYRSEVNSLNSKVQAAIAHSPVERKAQLLADTTVSMFTKENPGMTTEEKSKVRAKALSQARATLGSKKPTIKISDKEWEAIQAGALSKTKQAEVFKYADQDELKERATPRDKPKLTPSVLALAKARMAMGYTMAEIADSLGVSASTLSRALS